MYLLVGIHKGEVNGSIDFTNLTISELVRLERKQLNSFKPLTTFFHEKHDWDGYV